MMMMRLEWWHRVGFHPAVSCARVWCVLCVCVWGEYGKSGELLRVRESSRCAVAEQDSSAGAQTLEPLEHDSSTPRLDRQRCVMTVSSL